MFSAVGPGVLAARELPIPDCLSGLPPCADAQLVA